MIKNLKIKSKLYTAFGLIMVLMTIFTIIVFANLKKIENKTDQIIEVELDEIENISFLRDGQKEMGVALRGMISNIIFENKEFREKHEEYLNHGMKEWDENYEKIDKSFNDENERELWNEYIELSKPWRSGFDEFHALYKQKLELYDSGIEISDDKIKTIDKKMYDQFEVLFESYLPMSSLSDEMIHKVHKIVDIKKDDIDKLQTSTKIETILLFMGSLIISVFLSIFISKQIS
ncbi:MAG: MCP four helix bundle domain-containing protein, partial [Clostridiales bacterium]